MERPLEKSARPRLLDQVRDAIRVRHYSYETEKAYVYWVRFFIRFSGLRHPEELHEDDVGRFLTFLAVARRVSPSTQNQALNALVFLYKHVLQRPLGHIGNAARAKPRERLPVVFTPSEVQAIVSRLDGLARVIVCLLYGSGLRLMECLRLRIKDIDFERNEITVRDGKGGKDRVTILSSAIKDDLRGCIQRSKNLHDYDLAEGTGRSRCRMRWTRNIRERRVSCAGSTSFRPRGDRSTRFQERSNATMYCQTPFSGTSNAP